MCGELREKIRSNISFNVSAKAVRLSSLSSISRFRSCVRICQTTAPAAPTAPIAAPTTLPSACAITLTSPLRNSAARNAPSTNRNTLTRTFRCRTSFSRISSMSIARMVNQLALDLPKTRPASDLGPFSTWPTPARQSFIGSAFVHISS